MNGPTSSTKKLGLTLLLLILGWGAAALDKIDLDQRVAKLAAKFDAMQARPDKRVPAELLAKARGIILLDRTKAGFVFAYQGGSGMAMVKDKKNRWSPLAFMKADEGSIGFQIGGQQSFFVILLMNEMTAKTLIADAAFEVGGEARGTAGDNSTGVETKVEDVERSVIVYDDRQGLFGGAAVKGGALSPDPKANQIYYGGAFTMHEILFEKKLTPTKPAAELGWKIDRYSREKK